MSKTEKSSRKFPKFMYDWHKDNHKGEWYRFRLPPHLGGKMMTITLEEKKAIALCKVLGSRYHTLTNTLIEKIMEDFGDEISAKPINKKDSVMSYLLKWRESLADTDPVRYHAIREDAENKNNNDWYTWLLAKRFAVFCHEKNVAIRDVDSSIMLQFWGTLSNDMQRKQIMLRRFLSWCIALKYCRKITVAEISPANVGGILVYSKRDAKKERHRLKEMDEFWAIYNKAGEMNYDFLQHAMLLGLFTTLREGDLLTLRRDEGGYEDGLLRKSILKSHNSKGEALGTNLFWDLSKHKDLAMLLEHLDKRSKKMNNCPFFICHKHEVVRGKKREHRHQVMSSFLQHTFSEVRDATGLWDHLDQNLRPGFNQIRSLASRLCEEKFGYSMNAISEGMAHTNPKNRKEGAPITYRYTSVGYPLKWTESELVIDGNAVGLHEHFQIIEKPVNEIWQDMTMDELQRLLWQKPITHIAAQVGVSDSIICRVVKNNNLIQPKVGFWTMVLSGKVNHPQGEVMLQYAK